MSHALVARECAAQVATPRLSLVPSQSLPSESLYSPSMVNVVVKLPLASGAVGRNEAALNMPALSRA